MNMLREVNSPPFRIGVIADTHGLLRPELADAFQGVHHILHAGDVGDSAILDELRTVAPLTAIRGNVDRKGPCSRLPEIETIQLAGHTLYMLHDAHALDLDPVAAGFSAVISGHSHHPKIEWARGVLHLNPGSAGPRRFALPISLGFITIHDGRLEPTSDRATSGEYARVASDESAEHPSAKTGYAGWPRCREDR